MMTMVCIMGGLASIKAGNEQWPRFLQTLAIVAILELASCLFVMKLFGY